MNAKPQTDLAVLDPRYSELVALLTPALGSQAPAFVGGGLCATGGIADSRQWFQLQIRPHRHADAAAYHRVLDLVTQVRDDPRVSAFFFMHKPPGTSTTPPGLRLRFRVLAERRQVADRAAAMFASCLSFPSAELSTYEPECSLFGGPAAMEAVHRVFEADSLLWLSRHAEPDRALSWMVALAVARRLLRALNVLGEEDRDVWTWIVKQGRRSPDSVAPRGDEPDADEVVELWRHPSMLAARLGRPTGRLLDGWSASVGSVQTFGAGLASIGPREAAALMTIFAWNRALLTTPTQAAVAHALSTRGRQL